MALMKKITTEHGTQYLLDEDNKRVRRVPATVNILLYDGLWVDYISATNSENGPYQVGDRLFIVYGSGRDMPWSLSTRIISIEEVEDERVE